MLPPCLVQPAFSWDPGPPTVGWALLYQTLILKSTDLPTSQPYFYNCVSFSDVYFMSQWHKTRVSTGGFKAVHTLKDFNGLTCALWSMQITERLEDRLSSQAIVRKSHPGEDTEKNRRTDRKEIGHAKGGSSLVSPVMGPGAELGFPSTSEESVWLATQAFVRISGSLLPFIKTTHGPRLPATC